MTKDNTKAKWYIVRTQSVIENKIKEEIEQRIKALDLKKKIQTILIPTQKKIVIRKGKKYIKQEKVYPGYIFIQMVMEPATFSVVRNVEGVKGFVSVGKKPKPLSEKEVQNIMRFQKDKTPTYQKTFQVGEAVKIKKGAFTDFVGSVKEVNQDKGKLSVLISIFGRETPVDVASEDVDKLT